MSSRSGGADKGAPRHQNTFAFRHNPKSRLTKKILSLPGTTDNLCPRCQAIIEWRKKYRKYKPLKARKHCNGCAQKAVSHAYHHLCQPCSLDREQCAKCMTPMAEWRAATARDLAGGGEGDEEEDEDDEPIVVPKRAPAALAAGGAGAASASAKIHSSLPSTDLDLEERNLRRDTP